MSALELRAVMLALLPFLLCHLSLHVAGEEFTRYNVYPGYTVNNVLEATYAKSITECAWLCSYLQHGSAPCRSATYNNVTDTCYLSNEKEWYITDTGNLNHSTVALPQSNPVPGVDWLPFGDNKYLFHSDSRTWLDAWNFCESKGGKLTKVATSGVHDFIRSTLMMMNLGNLDMYWTGGNARQTGEWFWDLNSTDPLSNTTFWSAGQPDNFTSPGNLFQGEACMAYLPFMNYSWNDIYCQAVLGSICQKPKSN